MTSFNFHLNIPYKFFVFFKLCGDFCVRFDGPEPSPQLRDIFVMSFWLPRLCSLSRTTFLATTCDIICYAKAQGVLWRALWSRQTV